MVGSGFKPRQFCTGIWTPNHCPILPFPLGSFPSGCEEGREQAQGCCRTVPRPRWQQAQRIHSRSVWGARGQGRVPWDSGRRLRAGSEVCAGKRSGSTRGDTEPLRVLSRGMPGLTVSQGSFTLPGGGAGARQKRGHLLGGCRSNLMRAGGF